MIVITAPVHPFLLEYLKEKSYEISYEPDVTYADLYTKIDQVTGLFVTTRINIDRPLLEKAKNLKWIGRLGSGMEIIDVTAALEMGIRCESSPEGNCTAVGELALGLMIGIMHRIHFAANEVKEMQWNRASNRGWELTGKTVGIIGYGNTGSALSNLLRGFGVRILAHDKYKTDISGEYVEPCSLETILKEADVISLHLPLTSETHHYVNEDFLNEVVRKPYIINTSRGKVVDTQALKAALEAGKISGVGLDVIENEKVAQYNDEEKSLLQYFSHHPMAIVTPHIAGYTHESYRKMAEVLIRKLSL